MKRRVSEQIERARFFSTLSTSPVHRDEKTQYAALPPLKKKSGHSTKCFSKQLHNADLVRYTQLISKVVPFMLQGAQKERYPFDMQD